MSIRNLLVLGLMCFSMSACERQEPPVSPAESGAEDRQAEPVPRTIEQQNFIRDPHSFSNPEKVLVAHIDLDLTVDFEHQRLEGTAKLIFERIDPDARELVLDTRDLEIESVEVLGNDYRWSETPFRLDPRDENLGSALRITLPPDAETVRVSYRTSPAATGLQWLAPAQTAGKQHPFLFTQSQAIHARSWIPLQDTPQVRTTYTATVRTPKELLAVMSAENELETDRDGEYRFEMPQAVPSYLIALGVGDLEFRPMSERTGVYAEPSILVAAAAEFEDTEQMLQISERLYGPYRWGRYDLLILPPSFPFGGMENPRLSFITPTVIAGDKSLVSLIAHELAHSWSGNLVTNAAWRDLWLNEGFTTYVTSRIMEAVYGERRAAMEDVLDLQDLERDMAEVSDQDEQLAIDLQGRDPDDAFSNVPYVKGALLLTYLEHQFGREAFDQFLRDYFDRFAFQSLSTAQFVDYLEQHLLSGDPSLVTPFAIEQWIYKPGLPETAVLPESDAFDMVALSQKEWLVGETPAAEIDTQDWTVHEWRYFLNTLPEQLTLEQMQELDATFALTGSSNNEIAHSWLLVAIRNGYEPAFPRLENYLVEIGRRKLIEPLYKALMTTPQGAEFARRVYAKARPGYHSIAVSTMDEIVLNDEG